MGLPADATARLPPWARLAPAAAVASGVAMVGMQSLKKSAACGGLSCGVSFVSLGGAQGGSRRGAAGDLGTARSGLNALARMA